MSTLIDVDVSDVGERSVLSEGEFQLRILSAEYKEGTKNDRDWALISLNLLPIAGEDLPEDPDTFYSAVFLPGEDASKGNKRRWNAFKEACEINPAEAFDVEDLVGCEPWTVVGVEDDPEYGRQNKVKRWTPGA